MSCAICWDWIRKQRNSRWYAVMSPVIITRSRCGPAHCCMRSRRCRHVSWCPNGISPTGAPSTLARSILQILNSGSEPGDAFVSVHYRDHWFYIDDRDLVSKRALLFIMLLFTLADTGTEHPAPLLTIPTQ